LQAGALRVDKAGNALEHPIRIEWRPSLRVAALLATVHLGALAAVALAGIPGWLKFVIDALIAAVFIGRARRTLREYLDPAPPVLQLNRRDEWHLLRAGGSDRLAPGSESFSHPSLIVLHLRDAAGASRFFVLAGDNAGRDDLRRLRVRLRFPISRPA
jgi:hypothetical protein